MDNNYNDNTDIEVNIDEDTNEDNILDIKNDNTNYNNENKDNLDNSEYEKVYNSNYSIKNNKEVKKNNSGVIFIVSMLLSFICGMIGAYVVSKTVSVESVVKNITTSELVETSISTSVDKVYNSTVIILSYSKGKLISTGTGFVYKKNSGKAYIMTNNHVIDGADSVKVEFNNNDVRIDTKIVGGDKYADIAVLTIDDKDVADAVEIGETESANLGDTIFTVGSPMGIEYKGTVTKGIVSGKERMVAVNVSGSSNDYYMKVIQIDAAVNPGNSGGPLCDVSGKVIGIISLKIVQDEVEGMGFAIPIEDALKYASLIEKGGQVQRPYIGISMIDLTDEYTLWKYKINVPDGIDEGVAVVEIVDGSPADKAGLKSGDIIVSIGGKEVGSLAEFRYELYQHEVSEKVGLVVFREGKKLDISIVLGKSE